MFFKSKKKKQELTEVKETPKVEKPTDTSGFTEEFLEQLTSEVKQELTNKYLIEEAFYKIIADAEKADFRIFPITEFVEKGYSEEEILAKAEELKKQGKLIYEVDYTNTNKTKTLVVFNPETNLTGIIYSPHITGYHA